MTVEKCPRWNFWTPQKPRNLMNKSGNDLGDTLYNILNIRSSQTLRYSYSVTENGVSALKCERHKQSSS